MKEILSYVLMPWFMIGILFAGLSTLWAIIQATKAACIIGRGAMVLLPNGQTWPPESDSTRMFLSIIGRFGLLPSILIIIAWPFYLYVFWKNARRWNFVQELRAGPQKPE